MQLPSLIQSHLQNDLNIVGVAFALLVSSKLGTAVQKRSDNPRLVGVDRGKRDKRGRGREGHGGVTEVFSGDRHGSRIAGLSPTAVSGCPGDRCGKGVTESTNEAAHLHSNPSKSANTSVTTKLP